MVMKARNLIRLGGTLRLLENDYSVLLFDALPPLITCQASSYLTN
jgi:hypothetical protein